MKVTYIHHSSFLIETERCYYLFDYEQGELPKMDNTKPIYVLASHGHHDHYNADVFSLLNDRGMEVLPILSDDIDVSKGVDALQVASGCEYDLGTNRKLTTFKSPDVGVAFLIEDEGEIIYHAGDLNDWVWEGESASYNEQMTKDYQEQMCLLSQILNGKEIDVAFVVLDPRQEKDYDKGMCYFLEHIPVKDVYPMHYWGKPEIVDMFLESYPEYKSKIKYTETMK